MVVVISYTMFPDALCPAMVDEVSQALSWTFDNAASYGGDPARIAALGHSAGSHLVAAALLQRARADSSRELPQPQATATNPPNPHTVGSIGMSSQHGTGPALTTTAQSADLDWHPRDGDQFTSGADNRVDWGQGTRGSSSGSEPGAADQSHASTERSSVHGSGLHGRVSHDSRLPWVFIGMAGVYDISKHFEFERMRGVEGISMMKRAMGGFSGFDAMSPSVQLSQAWSNSVRPLSMPGIEAGHSTPAAFVASPRLPSSASPTQSLHQSNNNGSTEANEKDVAPQYFTSFPLLGDAIPARFTPTSAPTMAQRIPAAAHPAAVPLAGSLTPVANNGNGASQASTLQLWQAQRLCPVVLMSSAADHMVPWHESAELIHHLSMCGVPCRHLMYNHVRHSEYVLAWTLLKGARQPRTHSSSGDSNQLSASGGGSGEGEAMSPFAVDLLRLLFSEGGDHVQELECSRRQQQQVAQGAAAVGWAPAASGWPVARL